MAFRVNVSRWLRHTSTGKFSLYCMLAAFLTYCSMYAFRKPFTAAMYTDLVLWGVDYKIILISSQVIGYMLSKFLGISVISAMPPSRRIHYIALFIGIAWVALLFFGMVPHPYNFVFLFLNGLPLGMIWGLVFAFLEGRKNTEMLGAGMSASFIVASGVVKAVGKFYLEQFGVSEFWMPFLTGLSFIPLLMLGVWMLSRIPPPDGEDIALRTERVPMSRRERWAFFRQFSAGIVIVVLIYMALTIYRDLRDNFAVELWAELGFANNSTILAVAEIPIAISVLVITSLMILIRNNRIAFFSNMGMILLGGVILLLLTALFSFGLVGPVTWMILTGFGMYLSYVSYHTMLFERWIALFRYRSNIGYLMYVADAFGYLGSVIILFYRNFATPSMNWLSFIRSTAVIAGIFTILLVLFSIGYFRRKERALA